MVKLKEFVKKIKNTLKDECIFINKETGEIKSIEKYYLNYDNEKEKRILLDWQIQSIEEGQKILKDRNYISCNIKNEFNEYFLMEEFLRGNLSNEERKEIEFIINGQNRFKRFHLAILGTYYENLWDIFIEDQIEKACKKWLYNNEVTYY